MADWVSLLQEATAAEYGARPVVAALATADDQGRPRVRHVVCRHFDAGNVWIASDQRSGKNLQACQRNAAELAIYLPSLRQRFRLLCTVTELNMPNAPERPKIWAMLSDATRAMFFWPEPGAPREVNPAAFPLSVPSTTPPPPNFEPIVLHPEEVDHLDLGVTPHRRRRWRHSNGWAEKELNP